MVSTRSVIATYLLFPCIHAFAVPMTQRRHGNQTMSLSHLDAIHGEREFLFQYQEAEPKESMHGLRQKKDSHGKYFVPVIHRGGVEWCINVRLGGINFHMLPDTGSVEVWVPGDNCDKEMCYDHQRYKTTADNVEKSLRQLKSPMFLQLKDQNKDLHTMFTNLPSFHIVYGSGDIRGNTICDDISFDSGVTNVHNCFGLIHQHSLGGFYQKARMDGVLGLSFPSLKQSKGESFLQSFRQLGKPSIFSFYMAKEGDNTEFPTTRHIFTLGEEPLAACRQAGAPLNMHQIDVSDWWDRDGTLTLYPPEKSYAKNAHPYLGEGTAMVMRQSKESDAPRSGGRSPMWHPAPTDEMSKPLSFTQKVLFDTGTSMMCLNEAHTAVLKQQLHSVLSDNAGKPMSFAQLTPELNRGMSLLELKLDDKTYTLQGADMVQCKEHMGQTMNCELNVENRKTCCSELKDGCPILGTAFFQKHLVTFHVGQDGAPSFVQIGLTDHNNPDCKLQKDAKMQTLRQTNEAKDDEDSEEVGINLFPEMNLRENDDPETRASDVPIREHEQ